MRSETVRCLFDPLFWLADECHKENTMLHYAVIFLVIALIAGILGFGGIAGTAVGIAKILFYVFLVLFILSFIFGRRKP